jgi:Uma2 family endonuclease
VVAEPATWPEVPGRLEFVEGRLEYMPPCGGDQQRTAVDVVTVLGTWRRKHPGFVVGSNEAGMLLDGEVRAADAAVWRREDVRPGTELPTIAPILAVEVAGRDDDMASLVEKAKWYLSRGVAVVWLLDPEQRHVSVVTPEGIVDVAWGERVPRHPSLPNLGPEVADLFVQIGPR